jgi:GT2 family glycosyltransferase/O-antigen ligase
VAYSHVEPAQGIDTTTVLTVYVCLLLAIPSPIVIGALGSAGAPSTVMAVGTFYLWAWFQIHRSKQAVSGHQPVRAAALGWLLAMLIVYAHAMSSPMSADEISGADNGLLKLIGLSGLVLFANDGIASLERHRALLRRLVIGVAVVAVLGVIQYATKQLYVDRINIPGLTNGTAEWQLVERNGLARTSGTSTHPIEYGVLLTMVLPIAITFAMKSPTHRWTFRAILCAISFAVFLSLSRSAIVCAGVALLVLALSWSMAVRVRVLAAVLAAAVGVYLAVPRVLGTITGLFTGVSNDDSISSRTGSYDLAEHFISRSPLLGRGFGTFLPKYWILDNEYLGLLIEGGIIALGGLLVLIVAALAAAWKARRMAMDEFDRDLAQALLASIAAGACSLAFFDTFAFPQSAGCFFLILGMAGAMRRLIMAHASTDNAAQIETAATPNAAVRTATNSPEPRLESGTSKWGPVNQVAERSGSGGRERIAIVVVMYNSRSLLADLVASLDAGLAGVDFELVAVDNASPDDSAELIEAIAPNTTIVRTGRNGGYAAGINAGVAAAGPHTAILALNPDVRLGAGCVPELMRGLRRPGIGIAVPRLVDAHGRVIDSMRREPTVARAFGDAILGARRAGRFVRFGEVVSDRPAYDCEQRTDWAEGSTQLISAECWRACGGWDERFFLYSEETEYGLRARDNGYATLYVPTARAIHLEGGSAGSPKLWAMLVTNRIRFFRLRHGPLHTAAFWAAILVREASRALLGKPTSQAALHSLLDKQLLRRAPGPEMIS